MNRGLFKDEKKKLVSSKNVKTMKEKESSISKNSNNNTTTNTLRKKNDLASSTQFKKNVSNKKLVNLTLKSDKEKEMIEKNEYYNNTTINRGFKKHNTINNNEKFLNSSNLRQSVLDIQRKEVTPDKRVSFIHSKIQKVFKKSIVDKSKADISGNFENNTSLFSDGVFSNGSIFKQEYALGETGFPNFSKDFENLIKNFKDVNKALENYDVTNLNSLDSIKENSSLISLIEVMTLNANLLNIQCIKQNKSINNPSILSKDFNIYKTTPINLEKEEIDNKSETKSENSDFLYDQLKAENEWIQNSSKNRINTYKQIFSTIKKSYKEFENYFTKLKRLRQNRKNYDENASQYNLNFNFNVTEIKYLSKDKDYEKTNFSTGMNFVNTENDRQKILDTTTNTFQIESTDKRDSVKLKQSQLKQFNITSNSFHINSITNELSPIKPRENKQALGPLFKCESTNKLEIISLQNQNQIQGNLDIVNKSVEINEILTNNNSNKTGKNHNKSVSVSAEISLKPNLNKNIAKPEIKDKNEKQIINLKKDDKELKKSIISNKVVSKEKSKSLKSPINEIQGKRNENLKKDIEKNNEVIKNNSNLNKKLTNIAKNKENSSKNKNELKQIINKKEIDLGNKNNQQDKPSKSIQKEKLEIIKKSDNIIQKQINGGSCEKKKKRLEIEDKNEKANSKIEQKIDSNKIEKEDLKVITKKEKIIEILNPKINKIEKKEESSQSEETEEEEESYEESEEESLSSLSSEEEEEDESDMEESEEIDDLSEKKTSTNFLSKKQKSKKMGNVYKYNRQSPESSIDENLGDIDEKTPIVRLPKLKTKKVIPNKKELLKKHTSKRLKTRKSKQLLAKQEKSKNKFSIFPKITEQIDEKEDIDKNENIIDSYKKKEENGKVESGIKIIKIKETIKDEKGSDVQCEYVLTSPNSVHFTFNNDKNLFSDPSQRRKRPTHKSSTLSTTLKDIDSIEKKESDKLNKQLSNINKTEMPQNKKMPKMICTESNYISED